jgi:FkbM family methyltransferase
MKPRFLYRAFRARYRDQRSEIEAALRAVRAGDTAVDVGANKGAYLYWLRRGVGTSGKVVAFEPQPALALYLRSIAAAMRWENVRVEACALSDSTGARTLYVPGQGVSQGASLEPTVAATGPSRSYECEADTLDRRLRDAGPVSFLKVDVEGHELEVFRGAAGTLSTHSPAVLFECESRHLRRHGMPDVFAFLHGLGYEGAFFSPRGLSPLREFDPKLHQKQDATQFWKAPGYCNNFLFTRR